MLSALAKGGEMGIKRSMSRHAQKKERGEGKKKKKGGSFCDLL